MTHGAGLADILREHGQPYLDTHALPAAQGKVGGYCCLPHPGFGRTCRVGPAQVLEYLGRYTHRVAISNERILGMKGNRVRLGQWQPQEGGAP